MTRARLEGDALTFEDPASRLKVTMADLGDVEITDGEHTIWMRASDAASVGDWLRRRFYTQDWRNGVDPAHTSIPQEPTEP